MVDTINIPATDNFQIITEHDKNTLNEGRTVELKKAFYKWLAERLHEELNICIENVFISLVEVKKENWSFGNGVAQYAE